MGTGPTRKRRPLYDGASTLNGSIEAGVVVEENVAKRGGSRVQRIRHSLSGGGLALSRRRWA